MCGSLTIREVLDDYFTQSQVPIIEIDLDNNNDFIIKHKFQNNKWNVPLFLNDKTIVWLLKNDSLCPPNKLSFESILNYKSYSFSIMRYSLNYWNNLLEFDLSKIDGITLIGLVQSLDLQIKQQK